MAVTAASLIAQISVNGADKAKADLEGVGSSATSLGGVLKAGLIGAGVAAGAAVIGIGVASTKMAGDYQAGLTSLVTGAGEAQKNLGMVSSGMLKMAVDTGTSTKQLTDGMYMIESGGYHGAAGLAILQAAAEGAKVGNADLGVVADATDTVLKNFGSTGLTASGSVNTLIATVARGKTHMSDLSSSLSQILPTASAARVGLNDVMGSMATMTGEGIPAANAATYLRQMLIALQAPSAGSVKALKDIGLTTGDVATAMHKSLPDALQMITDRLKKVDGEGTPAYLAAIKNISGGSKTMQGMLDLTGSHLAVFKDNVSGIAGAVKQGGNSIVGWSDVQQTFNFRLDQAKAAVETMGIKLGTALLPALSQVLGFVTQQALPALERFGDWFSTTAAPVLQRFATLLISNVGPAVQKVAAFFQSPGFQSFASGVGQAISLVLTGIGNVARQLAPIFYQIASTLAANFVPAWKSLQPALQGALPVLEMIGKFLGGALLVAIGLVISAAAGLINGLASAEAGISRILSGIITIFTGAFQIVGGIVNVFIDIFTGKWSHLGADLATIGTGIKNIFVGLWQVVSGVFQTGVSFIVGVVGGFIRTIVGYFTGLYDTLVGHSIIPDMVNGIVNWIAQLPGRAGAFINSLISTAIGLFLSLASRALGAAQVLVDGVIGWIAQLPGRAGAALSGIVGVVGGILGNLASQALNWGSDLVQNIAAGITGAIGAVTNAVGAVGNAISNVLHHSKPETGPLANDDQWMPDFMAQLAGGIEQNMSKVKNASLKVASTIQTSVVSGGSGSSVLTGGMQVVPPSVSQSAMTPTIVVQSGPIYLDGRLLSNGLMPYMVNGIRANTSVKY